MANNPHTTPNSGAPNDTDFKTDEHSKSENLEKYRSDATGHDLRTNHGARIADNLNSLKAGERGPTLLEDFVFREKLNHFDNERIPERIVHARGGPWLLPALLERCRILQGEPVPGPQEEDAGLRALLHRAGRSRLQRHRARRARLRHQVLHRRGQLGPGRQRHAGILHPGRDQVSRFRPCSEARAAQRNPPRAVGPRYLLGFRLADAGVDPHGAVDHVRPCLPTPLSQHGRLRRTHLPPDRQASRASSSFTGSRWRVPVR